MMSLKNMTNVFISSISGFGALTICSFTKIALWASLVMGTISFVFCFSMINFIIQQLKNNSDIDMLTIFQKASKNSRPRNSDILMGRNNSTLRPLIMADRRTQYKICLEQIAEIEQLKVDIMRENRLDPRLNNIRLCITDKHLECVDLLLTMQNTGVVIDEGRFRAVKQKYQQCCHNIALLTKKETILIKKQKYLDNVCLELSDVNNHLRLSLAEIHEELIKEYRKADSLYLQILDICPLASVQSTNL